MKTLCDLSKKDIEKHVKKIIKENNKPLYFCSKCARVANSKKQLCEPETIKYK